MNAFYKFDTGKSMGTVSFEWIRLSSIVSVSKSMRAYELHLLDGRSVEVFGYPINILLEIVNSTPEPPAPYYESRTFEEE